MKKPMSFMALLFVFGIMGVAFADTPQPGVKMPPEVRAALQRMAQSYAHANPARIMQQRKAQIAVGTISPSAAVNMRVPLVIGTYSNSANRYTAQQFQNQLFDSNPTGTMIDYYREVSYNQLVLTGGTHGWYNAPQTQSFYVGSNSGLNGGGARFSLDLVKLADPTVDFSQYDNDGDGYVDVLMVVHTGPGAETQSTRDNIWSHSWNFNSARQNYPGIMPQGEYTTNDPRPGFAGQFIKINDYIIQPEEAAQGDPSLIDIGVFCHEFGHALGLPDLYDTDGSSRGLGLWCLMASGSYGGDGQHSEKPAHMSAWCKLDLGWITPVIVTTDRLAQQILPIEQNASQIYKLAKDGLAANEYFLVENRQRLGFDQYLTGAGLIIWHIDAQVIANERNNNRVNTNENHKGIDVEEADGRRDLDLNANSGDAGDVFPGSATNRTFDFNSNPNSRDYTGATTKVEVLNITLTSQNASADLKVGQPGTAANDIFTVYNDGTVPLSVTAINSNKTWLSATPTSFTVAAAGSQAVQVAINWANVPAQEIGTLSVLSNDPNQSTVAVQVTAVPRQTSSITVTAPAAGATWNVGSSQTVTWTSSNVTGNVNIKLSTDGGATFPITLASNTANDGSESITVPNNPSTTCLVRVESVSNTSVFGNNPGNFTIASSSTCTPTNCAGPAIFPVAQGITVFGQTIKAKDGQTVCIDIRLKENGQPIDAFGFKLQVDPSQFTFVSVEKGDLTANFITVNAQENPAGSGNFTCGGFNTTAIPANSSGVLMRLCFTVKCNTVTASEIVLSAPTDDLAGFATCCNRFECVTCVRDGDLNGDGTLTPGDALCAFQIFLNNGSVPASCDVAGFDCEAVASDVNCDNTTTPGDALAIFSRFLQNQPPLECFARTAAAQASLPYQLALVSRTVVSSANNQTLVKVALRVANPQHLRAFGLQLHYPAEQLELLGVTRAALTQDWVQLEGKVHEAGLVRVGGFNDESIATNAAGELFEIVFASKTATPSLNDFAVTGLVDGFTHAQIENGTTSVNEEASVPSAFKLHQSYPNPFNSGAQGNEMIIRFDLPGAAHARVELAVYNLAGQLVRQLVSGEHRPGAYEISWDGKDERGQLAPSGTYLYRLKAGGFSESRQLTIVR